MLPTRFLAFTDIQVPLALCSLNGHSKLLKQLTGVSLAICAIMLDKKEIKTKLWRLSRDAVTLRHTLCQKVNLRRDLTWHFFETLEFFLKFRRGSYHPKEQLSTKPRDFLPLRECKNRAFLKRVILHSLIENIRKCSFWSGLSNMEVPYLENMIWWTNKLNFTQISPS